MEINLSFIADVCGIVGFVISLITLGGVIKINNKINSSTKNDVNNTSIGGDYTGRDKTHR